VNVTDNHFSSDFLFLDKKYSCFQVSTELSFQNGEYVFNELTSAIFLIIELLSHFLSVFPTDDLIVPGTDRDGECDKSYDSPKIGIDGDRSFEEMVPNLTGSGRIIMAAIPAGKT
jgi:hypothetical protein